MLANAEPLDQATYGRSLNEGMDFGLGPYRAPVKFAWSRRVRLACLCAAVMLPWSPAQAHHSFAAFDETRVVSVAGTVKTWRWANPHTQVVLTVGVANNGSVDYDFEGWAPALWQRQGWVRTSAKVGDKVKIEFHPYRSEMLGGSIVNMTGPQGESLKYKPQ